MDILGEQAASGLGPLIPPPLTVPLEGAMRKVHGDNLPTLCLLYNNCAPSGAKMDLGT